MVPTLKNLSKNFQKVPVKFGAVNCEDDSKNNRELAENMGIEGFPSLFLIKKSGRLVEYNGERDENGIAKNIINKYKL